MNKEKLNYPYFKTSNKINDYFGYKLEDPYEEMRNPDNPKVVEWVKKENELTDEWFSKLPLNEKIIHLKNNKVKEIPFSISKWKEGYLASGHDSGNYITMYLDKDFNEVEVVFDNETFEEYTVFSAEPSIKDENLLALMAQKDNDPRPTWLIYDYKNKKIVSTMIYSFSGLWAMDGNFYYSDTVDGITSFKVYHPLNNEVKTIKWFSNAIFAKLAISSDKNLVVVEVCKNYSDSLFYVYNLKDLEELSDQYLQLSYMDTVNDNHYFIDFTNNNQGEIIKVKKSYQNKERVTFDNDAFIQEGFKVGDKLFVLVSENASSKLVSLSDNKEIILPEEVCNLGVLGKNEDEVIFSYESFLTKPVLARFNDEKMDLIKYKKEENNDIEITLEYGKSNDGTMVPYYMVKKNSFKQDENNPVLMYGYGGYNVSNPPVFRETITNINIKEWVNKGGIYVHTLIRGGNEYGSKWHEEGMKLNKKNCFNDFIGIAQSLIDNKWTRPDKLAAVGCSNGGLLMSAVVTIRPDLFGCLIDSVPHTDMINFAGDDRGMMYVTEYGNPKESKEMFEYLLSYSPIHNVRETNYPNIYIQTGECDNNVPPYHGKSFAAKLQENSTSNNPILLRVLKNGSHDRGKGDEFWKTIAEMQLFIEKNCM